MADIKIAYCISLYDLLNGILFENTEDGAVPVERKIPFKTKYKIQKNLNLLAKDFAFYEQEKEKLIRQYGVEGDGKITVTPENMDVFKEELGKILGMEVQRDFLKLTDEEIESINCDFDASCGEVELLIQYLTE